MTPFFAPARAARPWLPRRAASIRHAAMVLFGTLMLAAAPVSAKTAALLPPGANAHMALTVTLSPVGGHIVGSPAAPLKLVEYMSYTCPHCSAFEVEGMPALRLTAIAKGQVSIEIRHFLRDPVDATVAQLVNCASPQRFFTMHEAFLLDQSTWIKPLIQPSEAQVQHWYSGDVPTRMRNIASDFHLYEIAERYGVDRVAADRCFADKALGDRIALQTKDAMSRGITGTPSFQIGDLVLAGTYSWAVLEPQIAARLPATTP